MGPDRSPRRRKTGWLVTGSSKPPGSRGELVPWVATATMLDESTSSLTAVALGRSPLVAQRHAGISAPMTIWSIARSRRDTRPRTSNRGDARGFAAIAREPPVPKTVPPAWTTRRHRRATAAKQLSRVPGPQPGSRSPHRRVVGIRWPPAQQMDAPGRIPRCRTVRMVNQNLLSRPLSPAPVAWFGRPRRVLARGWGRVASGAVTRRAG